MKVEVTQDIEACLALRAKVFIEEQGVSEADELDGRDGESTHLLLLDGETPVGTARLMTQGNTGKVGRICVLKEYRGQGLGALLVRFTVDHFRTVEGVIQVKLGAQCHAIPFYENLGFTAFGPVYDDAGIDHRDMVHPL